jgi:membrane-bound lytic murein transglycosylase D
MKNYSIWLLVGMSATALTACSTFDGAKEKPAAATALQTHNVTDTPATTASRRHAELDATTPWWTTLARQENLAPNNTPWPKFPPTETLGNADNAIEAGTVSPNNLWQRLRRGFRLLDQDHAQVQPYIDQYTRHPVYLNRIAERARPFLYDIVNEIETRGMPLEIALLPIVESAFRPFAYSSGHAAGIWQFIPATGKLYGLKQNWWYDGRRDIHAATRAALNYLSYLHKRFDDDWLLALAAYNTGEGRLQRAINKNRARGRSTDFWSLDLPKETRGYVPKLLAISEIVHDPAQHGITLTSIPDQPYLERIDIGSQIDLGLAAELAGLPIETLYRLNPGFNRWATDPEGPHMLALPLNKATDFRTALAQVGKNQRIRWKRHRIRKGETLSRIARRFQTSVELLQQVNNIHDQWIHTGDNLIIPIASQSLTHYLSTNKHRLTLQRTPRRGIQLQHVVKRGDTFWGLSRKYQVKVSQLTTWNGMASKDALMPGQRLVIWTHNSRLAGTRFDTLPHNATRQQVHYRVRKGDSLARIAKKFRVTVAKLRSWNSLQGKYLQPGQRLTLYVDVTRQS